MRDFTQQPVTYAEKIATLRHIHDAETSVAELITDLKKNNPDHPMAAEAGDDITLPALEAILKDMHMLAGRE